MKAAAAPGDPLLSEFVDRLGLLLPALSVDDQRLAVALYRLLAGGEPVEPASLAASARLPEHVASAALSTWPDVAYDERGRIAGFGGLSIRETAHRLELDGRTLFTWCAWDALFLPEILGQTAQVHSSSPLTGATVALTVAPARVERVDPSSAVVSFVAADCCGGDVVERFCRFVQFFPSEEEASRWSAEHESAFLLSVQEAHGLGRLVNRARLGAVLSEEVVA